MAAHYFAKREVGHGAVDKRLHVREVLRVALCIPCPLDPRDNPPALDLGVFADQPGSGLCVQGSGNRRMGTRAEGLRLEVVG